MSESGSDLSVAGVIRACREARHLSARRLSLNAGLSDSVVGKIESRSIEPSLKAFAGIVTQLELTDREIAFLVRLATGRSGPADPPVPPPS